MFSIVFCPPYLVLYWKIKMAMTKQAFRKMKPKIQRRHHLNERLETATFAEGVSMQKSPPLQAMQKWKCFMDSLIAHMCRMLIYVYIGCLTDVIEFLCWKTSAVANDVVIWLNV